MTQTYFNTTNETGEELRGAKAAWNQQEVALFLMFRQYHALAPSEAWRLYAGEDGDTPITSIRRAISNLTRRGVLVKTKNKQIGAYGRNEHVWEMRRVR